MRRSLKKKVRNTLIGMCAPIAVFQLATCTIDEGGILNVSADLLGLSSLQGQIVENGGGFPFVGGGRGFGPRGFGGGFNGEAFEALLAQSSADEGGE